MLENEKLFFSGEAHLKGILFLQYWISTELCTLHTHKQANSQKAVEVYDLDENKH